MRCSVPLATSVEAMPWRSPFARLPARSARGKRKRTAVARAQGDFYKGRNITLAVGYSVGGGYDQYARALARHLGNHIPGHPNVLVQNMPGAASLTAVRYLDASAPKDGTVITMFDPGLITESFAAPDLSKLRFSDYQWIGTMLRDVRICYA